MRKYILSSHMSGKTRYFHNESRSAFIQFMYSHVISGMRSFHNESRSVFMQLMYSHVIF
jgi:hypothetical protein